MMASFLTGITIVKEAVVPGGIFYEIPKPVGIEFLGTYVGISIIPGLLGFTAGSRFGSAKAEKFIEEKAARQKITL